MNRELYYKLQNGSDIRGVALEGIEGEHVNLTSEAAKDFAKALPISWQREPEKKWRN